MGPDDEGEGKEARLDEDLPPNVLILPASVQRERDESDEALGTLGRPFDHRAPFFLGLFGALGVAVAYVIARGIADITTVLVIIGRGAGHSREAIRSSSAIFPWSIWRARSGRCLRHRAGHCRHYDGPRHYRTRRWALSGGHSIIERHFSLVYLAR